MHSVRAVSKTIIELLNARGISPIREVVPKLVYFAHGLMLVRHDRPLVDEVFQSWTYGPMIPSLYHDLRIFGGTLIDADRGHIPLWHSLPENSVEEMTALRDTIDQLSSCNFSYLSAASIQITSFNDPEYLNKVSFIPNERIKICFLPVVRRG